MLKALVAANLVLVLALGYGLFSSKTTISDRMEALESAAQETQAQTDKKLTDLMSDVALINKRVGVTATELTQSREIAQSLRRQQEQAAKELENQLARKANSQDVDTLRQEATTKMAEMQQDSTNK